MRTLLILIFLALSLTGCSKTDRGVSELTPEENAELNHYLTQRDDCLAQESKRLDDGRSDVNALTDLVMWKCGPIFRRISSLLYDKFKVALSSSYAFKVQMEETSKRDVAEAILTNRKMVDGNDLMTSTMMQSAPVILPQKLLSAPVQAVRGAVQQLPSISAPQIPAPEIPQAQMPIPQQIVPGQW